MTGQKPLILFPSDDAWRIGCLDNLGEVALHMVPVDAHEEAAAVASRVKETLDALGYEDGPLVLALPSEWCFCASLPSAALTDRRGNSREAQLYVLEERLPVSAEEIVADFVWHEDVAIAFARLKEPCGAWIHALEIAGASIGAVVPQALLATQAVLEEQDRAAGAANPLTLVLADDAARRADLIHLTDGRPRAWRTCPLRLDSVATELRALSRAGYPTGQVDVLGDGRGALCDLPARGSACADPNAGLNAVQVVATRMARGLIADVQRPWVDLGGEDRTGLTRRIKHVRKPLRAFALAVVAFLAAGAMSIGIRAHRYQRIIADERVVQAEAFRTLYPGVPVPIDVLGRLTAEARRMRGLSGDDANASQYSSDHFRSALDEMVNVLRSLPSEMRFRILELKVDRESVFIEGEARSHADAEAIAIAIRRGAALEVEAPRTEQRAGSPGVAFTLAASAKAANAEERRQQ